MQPQPCANLAFFPKLIYRNIVLAIATLLLLGSCDRSEVFIPRPRGYHRIELPEHKFVRLPAGYPYTFELSELARIVPDTSFIAEPSWIELIYPELNCTVHVSYKPVRNNLDSLAGYYNTSHRLTNKHVIRATAIDDYTSITPKGYTAVIFELEGDVPSQFQFFVTDSAKNFLRAALYFPTSTKNDSLAPVIEFMKYEMVHMLNTTDWTGDMTKTKMYSQKK